ncbi:MAG: anti-sigma factor antagonist [Actinobacteria bacterium]|nr:anti-sigma factor antagonist [Actinomycetota bacterium]NBY14892.1 anti-sigma factor antagonist [Actinomycetota bacterium]
MLLAVRSNEDHTVVSVEGEIDLSNSDDLDEAIIQALSNSTARITVDLTDVTFLDSSGLGVIVKGLKRAAEAESTFDVVASNERVLKVFKITGLDSVITIFSTLEDASSH